MAFARKADGSQQKDDARLLSLAINETDRAILILDRDRKIVYANRAFNELFEYSLEEILGKRPSDFLIGEKTDRASIERVRRKAAEGQSFQQEMLFYNKSGREIWISGTVNPIRDERDEVSNLVVVLVDLSEAKQIQRMQQAILEAVASGLTIHEIADLLCRYVEEIAPEVTSSVLAVDAEGRMRPLAGPKLPDFYVAAIDGQMIGEAAGSCGTAAHLGEAVCVTDIATDPRWARYKTLALPLGYKACWSSPIKLRSGRVAGTFAFYYTEQRGPSALHKELVAVCLHLFMLAFERDESRQKIARLSQFDALTGLANRTAFQRAASEMLVTYADSPSAFFVMNLDRFKDINDTLGHPAGDQILIEVAYRLQQTARPHGVVCRLAGDSFALVLPQCDVACASAMGDSILNVVKVPIDVQGIPLSLTASLGITVVHTRGNPETHLECALAALRRAKEAGRSCYHFFSPEMNQLAQDRLILGIALRNTLAEGALHLEYQPQISARTGELVGVEALSRWSDAKLGTISPSRFIPLAEEIGEIEAIGHWSLREACRQMAAWRAAGISVPSVSVNLSPLHFRSGGLEKFVEGLLGEYNLPASSVTIEITEGLMLNETQTTLVTMHALHELGCGISIDDFGTGFSNLSRLIRLPITELKLDQSFMRNFEEDPSSQAVATAVVRIGQSLGMHVVAEGVETAGQEKQLRKLGCDIVQGYLHGRPMPAADLQDWIATRQVLNM